MIKLNYLLEYNSSGVMLLKWIRLDQIENIKLNYITSYSRASTPDCIVGSTEPAGQYKYSAFHVGGGYKGKGQAESNSFHFCWAIV